MIRISIVTVCYNSASTIGATLRSVALQSHPLVEHLIVDGASHDETLDVVRREGPHVSRVISEPDKGIYDAMNKGLAMATGDLVAFLNSDDQYADPRVLEDVATEYCQSGADFIYGDLQMVNEIGAVVRDWKTGAISGKGLEGRQIPHPALFVKRALLVQLRPAFDASYQIAADLKQQLLLINQMKAKGRYLRRPLTLMKLGGTSTRSLRSYARGWKESVRAYNDVFGQGGLWFTTKKVASKLGGIKKLK